MDTGHFLPMALATLGMWYFKDMPTTATSAPALSTMLPTVCAQL